MTEPIVIQSWEAALTMKLLKFCFKWLLPLGLISWGNALHNFGWIVLGVVWLLIALFLTFGKSLPNIFKSRPHYEHAFRPHWHPRHWHRRRRDKGNVRAQKRRWRERRRRR